MNNHSLTHGNTETVLFVDDETPILHALERLFADENFTCLFASSAAEALQIAGEHTISVMVADNRMPGMNGIDLLSRIKTTSPDTVRMMMTSCIEMDIAVAAINRSEVYRFITKPWDNGELVTTVRDGITRFNAIVSLRSADEGRYRSLAQAIEMKDAYTRGHCDRVCTFALQLAGSAGVTSEMIAGIRQGSILHDCGKIGIPEALLNFPGKLAAEDFETIQQHPFLGAQLAREARLPQTVVNIILYHHERFDGKGYPTGIGGEEIPLEARIVTIADIYDALVSDRAYRKAYSSEEAVSIMEHMDGALDRQLLALFLGSVP